MVLMNWASRVMRVWGQNLPGLFKLLQLWGRQHSLSFQGFQNGQLPSLGLFEVSSFRISKPSHALASRRESGYGALALWQGRT